MAKAAGVDRVWVNRRQASAICGCGERNFDAQIRPRLPSGSVKGVGKKLELDAVAIVALLIEQRIDQARQGKQLTEEEAMLAGMDSPALERFRMGRAKLVEIELAEREKKLVRIDVIAEALAPAIAAMRTTGERLTKQFGNDAAEIFNEGVADFEAAALRVVEKAEGEIASNARPGG